MKITFFPALLLLFFSIVFICRIGSQNADNKRFEKECLKDQVDDTFYFIDFLDPLLLFCLPLPFMAYLYWGINGVLVLWILFSAGQLLVWIIAMKRYSNRPQVLKKKKWQTIYLCWIIGYLISLLVGIYLFVIR